MTLMPLTAACKYVPPRKTNEAAILWQLLPRQTLVYNENNRRDSVQADAAGMWRLPGNVNGNVCKLR